LKFKINILFYKFTEHKLKTKFYKHIEFIHVRIEMHNIFLYITYEDKVVVNCKTHNYITLKSNTSKNYMECIKNYNL
jgi:hypothetical protein